MDDHHRPSGYVSIHERRLELIERAILGPKDRPGPHQPVGPDELVVIDSIGSFIAGLVGMALQGVSVVFPFLLAAFIAPLWFLVVQYAFWAGGMALAIRLRARHGWLTLAVPIVSTAVWVLALNIGINDLGWPPLRF